MDTYIRGAREPSPVTSREYELSSIVDLRHLVALTKNYIRTYGEELTDNRMHKLVIDLLMGAMSNTRCTDSHRWIGKYFNEGSEFLDLFEQQVFDTLAFAMPLWREYDVDALHISMEDNPSSIFIGFKNMFENVNRLLLPTTNEDDSFLSRLQTSLFEQDFVIDFGRSMIHQVHETELMNLANGRITWAYLIEECLRINLELKRANTFIPDQISLDAIYRLVDFDELRTRFENSDRMDRLLTVSDATVAENMFDGIIQDLVTLIARIIHGNSDTLDFIYDQMLTRLNLMNYRGGFTINCTSFTWIGGAGLGRFTAYSSFIPQGR